MSRDAQIMGCADMPQCADMPLLPLYNISDYHFGHAKVKQPTTNIYVRGVIS